MKERLTGAVILVALIVVLVPELLHGPVRSAPPAAAPDARTLRIGVADDANSRAATARDAGSPQPEPVPAAPPPANPAPASPPVPTSAAPLPAPAPAMAPGAAAPGAAAPAPPAPSGARHATTAATAGGYVVQLGSFASRANAEKLARQLHGQGFDVNVSQGTTGRHLYRVRSAALHDKAAATALAVRLHAAGHAGTVVPQ